MKSSGVWKTILLLNPAERIKLLVFAVIQVLVNFLDLVGIVFVGALGALSVQFAQGGAAGNRVKFVLEIFRLSNLSFQNQILFLGITASSILILRTILSSYFTHKTFFFLAGVNASLSKDLVSRIVSQDILKIQNIPTQEILYITTTGVKNLTLGLLATTVSIISDLALLALMTIGILLLDPFIALYSVIIFLLTGTSLHLLLQVRARSIGRAENSNSVELNQKFLEFLTSYREISVHQRQHYFLSEMQELRENLSKLSAELQFQPYISKYVMETATIFSVIILAGFEFSTKNSVYAVSILAVFMTATSRIAPAALRIQQGLLVIKHSQGTSSRTLELFTQLQKIEKFAHQEEQKIEFEYHNFNSIIEVKNLNFSYSTENSFNLKNINFIVPAGTCLAIVGPSGAGKTTLVDLMLGLIDLQEGEVLISDIPTIQARKTWPGAISYIPQNVTIYDASIRENICQGYSTEITTDSRIWELLNMAQLEKTVKDWPKGLDTQVGERGTQLSGGQNQRLGIARALFTNPKILVLDEATSALDSATERDVGATLDNLSGEITRVIIAHRLSTIQQADQILYLDNGKILAIGTFDQVRSKVPEFGLDISRLQME